MSLVLRSDLVHGRVRHLITHCRAGIATRTAGKRRQGLSKPPLPGVCATPDAITPTRFLVYDKEKFSDASYHGVFVSAGRRRVALAKAIPPPMSDRGASPRTPIVNRRLRRGNGLETVRLISVAFVDVVPLWCNHQTMSRCRTMTTPLSVLRRRCQSVRRQDGLAIPASCEYRLPAGR